MLKTKSGGAKRKMHNTVMRQLGVVPEERDDQLTTELKRGGFASNGPRKGYFRHACYLGGVCVYSWTKNRVNYSRRWANRYIKHVERITRTHQSTWSCRRIVTFPTSQERSELSTASSCVTSRIFRHHTCIILKRKRSNSRKKRRLENLQILEYLSIARELHAVKRLRVLGLLASETKLDWLRSRNGAIISEKRSHWGLSDVWWWWQRMRKVSDVSQCIPANPHHGYRFGMGNEMSTLTLTHTTRTRNLWQVGQPLTFTIVEMKHTAEYECANCPQR